MNEIRAAVNKTNRATLWRNQVGFDAQNKVKYGLGVGSADLVGLIHKNGRLFAIEVKTPTGRISDEQKAWIAVINARGGYAAVARSVDEALVHLGAAE